MSLVHFAATSVLQASSAETSVYDVDIQLSLYQEPAAVCQSDSGNVIGFSTCPFAIQCLGGAGYVNKYPIGRLLIGMPDYMG
ncbi:hypothetical protein Ancab_010669 [Ancistrocladus abbreviatus]